MGKEELTPSTGPMNAAADGDKSQGSEGVQPPESGQQLCSFTALKKTALGWRHLDVQCLGSNAWVPANPALVSSKLHVLGCLAILCQRK